MDTSTKEKTNAFNLPGDRLSHILDQLGFKQGRGRVTDFQNYLKRICPQEFKDLKYTTVRAWFQDHAPPMHKIDKIIDALQIDYEFHNDISHIKTWWKAGGFYPFFDKSTKKTSSFYGLQQEIKTVKEKLPFVIMSIVMEETGDHFSSVSGSDLIRISDRATNFAEDFLDPFNIDCPDEYLRLFIKHELSKVLREGAD